MQTILYGTGPEHDNCREVIAFLGADCPECQLCHGSGEYDGEYGPKGCGVCNSRLIPVATATGTDYADWGDAITRHDDGSVTVAHASELF